MKRRNRYQYSPTVAHDARRMRRVAIACFSVMAAMLLVLAMAVRPVAYAAGPHSGSGSPHSGQGSAKKEQPSNVLSPVRSEGGSATVLVYMNGSDLESEAGEATSDIAEMVQSGIGANANVVIETLGTKEWQDFGIASDHTQRYAVEQGALELVDDSLGQLDTTASSTLSDFISWGVSNYPADRYILLFWDHGAGPVYGFGYDEFQSEESALTLDEMKQALQANPNVHFDIIGMDCCIMGSLETCLVLQPYCDYMVVSEDFEPGIGWSYQGWMSMLEQNPDVNTADLGKVIVDDMISDVAKDEENGDATLALVDESKVGELYQAWVSFAHANESALLDTNYSQETEWRDRPGSGSGNGRTAHDHAGASGSYGSSSGMAGLFGYDLFGYADGRDAYSGIDYGYGYDNGYGYGYGYDYGYGSGYSNDYGYGSYWDDWDYDGSYVTMTDYFITDIMQVASSIDGAEATALKSAFNDAMVHYGSTAGEEGMSGLGVTLPYADGEFYDELVKVFKACGIDGEYVDWLEAFVGVEGAYGSYDAYDDYGSSDYYGYGSGTHGFNGSGLDGYGQGGYGSDYGYGYGGPASGSHGQGLQGSASGNGVMPESHYGATGNHYRS